MVITRRWLHQNATKGCGWTKVQLKVLGVQWPPRNGWMEKLIGEEISADVAIAFVRMQGVSLKHRRLRHHHWYPSEKQREQEMLVNADEARAITRRQAGFTSDLRPRLVKNSQT